MFRPARIILSVSVFILARGVKECGRLFADVIRIGSSCRVDEDAFFKIKELQCLTIIPLFVGQCALRGR